tara:strand:+ start:261 stop:428 length:168 start_codon:yes stop_codon:yes gene_type:complete
MKKVLRRAILAVASIIMKSLDSEKPNKKTIIFTMIDDIIIIFINFKGIHILIRFF